MISVAPYSAADREIWDAFNHRARNGHLLFNRGFMDYHSDRFVDASQVLWLDGRIVALFPANRSREEIFSHQGLTFGGLVVGDLATTTVVLDCIRAIAETFARSGARRLVYKAMPSIYHARPAEEDLYALFRCGARLLSREVSTTIDFWMMTDYSGRRKRGIRKAQRAGLVYSESSQWGPFWEVLSTTLAERHGVAAVHSQAEIMLLASRFPSSIRLFTATQAGIIVAGVVIFETATVAHAQYIASSPLGREIGALDGLFDYTIRRYQADKRYFDFGISTEDGGQFLNAGLVDFKEEFGGTAIVHDRYELGF